MKQGLFLVLLLIYGMTGSSQKLYSWNAVAGNWEDAENWLPSRTEPHAGDTLVFSRAAQVRGLPDSMTIAALYINSGAQVEWQIAASATLHITGPDTSVQIGAGCSWQLLGPGGLIVQVQGVAEIAGSVYCRNGAHRLLPTVAGSNGASAAETGLIVFKGGATFNAGLGFSGNPFGTTALNRVVFQEGATFISLAGANPFGATAPGAVVVFEPGSIYKHQRSTAPQISGRKYGYFEIGANSSYNIAMSSDWVIKNDLIVSQGQFTLNPSGGIGNIIIKGGIVHNGIGDLQFGGAGWKGKVILDSNEVHFLKGGANSSAIRIDNLMVRDGNLVLEHPLSIGASLHLDSAIVNSNGMDDNSTNLLVMEAGSRFIFPRSQFFDTQHTTGYDAGYVEGSILWKGMQQDTSYAFPTGSNNRSRPVIIHGVAGAVMVRLYSESFLKLGPLAKNDSIVLVDSSVYWEITGLQTGADIEIGYNIDNWNFRPSQYRIAHFSNGYWKDTEEDKGIMMSLQATTRSSNSIGTVRGKYTGNTYYAIGSTQLLGTLNYVPPVLFRPNREGNNDFLISPNPVSEKLFIYFKNSRSKTRIDIVYITGAVVLSEEFEGERAVLDVSKLPNGMYFLQFRNKNLNRTQVFIKQ